MSKNWLKLTTSTLLVLALAGWMASQANIRPTEVWHTIQTLGVRYALLAGLGCFSQIFFLILRYQVLIPREIHPGFRRVVYAISLGHLVNTWFPARAGDVLKCFLLSKGPGNPMSLLSATGLLVGDRLVDVAALLLMAVFWESYDHPMMHDLVNGMSIGMGAAGGLSVAVAGVLGWFFIFRKRSARAAKWGDEFLTGMRNLGRPVPLTAGLFLAFLSWSGEVMAFQFLAQSQGVLLTFGNAIFVLLALNLAISVPLSFANVGPFEASIALALSTFGMDSSKALAVATVHHGIQLAAIGVWALIALVVRPRQRLANAVSPPS